MEFDLHTLIRFFPVLLDGLWMTVIISTVSLGIGIIIGLIACLGKLMERGIEYRLSTNFIDFFRTIPEMVLIFWVYSGYPQRLAVFWRYRFIRALFWQRFFVLEYWPFHESR